MQDNVNKQNYIVLKEPQMFHENGEVQPLDIKIEVGKEEVAASKECMISCTRC